MGHRKHTCPVGLVLKWLRAGVFQVHIRDSGEVQVMKRVNTKPTYVVLKQRLNKRKNSDRGDMRVDLCHETLKRSINVSHLVWMSVTGRAIPKGWEIHHIDDDPLNNTWENLVCLFPDDHLKFHDGTGTRTEMEPKAWMVRTIN